MASSSFRGWNCSPSTTIAIYEVDCRRLSRRYLEYVTHIFSGSPLYEIGKFQCFCCDVNAREVSWVASIRHYSYFANLPKKRSHAKTLRLTLHHTPTSAWFSQLRWLWRREISRVVRTKSVISYLKISNAFMKFQKFRMDLWNFRNYPMSSLWNSIIKFWSLGRREHNVKFFRFTMVW